MAKDKDRLSDAAEPVPQAAAPLDAAALAEENARLKAELEQIRLAKAGPAEVIRPSGKGPLRRYQVTAIGQPSRKPTVQPADVDAIDESEAIRLVVRAQNLEASLYTFRAVRIDEATSV